MNIDCWVIAQSKEDIVSRQVCLLYSVVIAKTMVVFGYTRNLDECSYVRLCQGSIIPYWSLTL